MGLDAIAKRYFPAIVCLLIAVAAYFQASGMGRLIAGSVVDGGGPVAAPAAAAHPAGLAHASKEHATAAAILERNPFDSVTGPLDGSNVEFAPPPPPPVPENTDPYEDPSCESAKVLLISAAEDPAWSFAAIAGPDGKAQLRRKGDDVLGQTVFHIAWDRVWLTSGSSRCQAVMGGEVIAKKGPTPAPAAAGTALPASPETGKSAKKVPAEIASRIHKVSETEFNVERGVVDQILENQAELMKSARIVPEKQGDKVVGIRLFGIRPDSLLGMLGMQNGDRLQTINGFDMASPEKALEAYTRLKTADHLTVTVNRRGKDQNLDFNINK
jgi:general secretion pathway protein C